MERLPDKYEGTAERTPRRKRAKVKQIQKQNKGITMLNYFHDVQKNDAIAIEAAEEGGSRTSSNKEHDEEAADGDTHSR
ncbi:hypothetical protein SARC_15832 [Sphaeroforma arctica JP610]|uniref:Uncharacterized protein n=1 Tax=Sphaeroforma arctica JP610 TaxID=667725 RepID=A0A0L0F4I2_9EUKA|nr:hypothetical protein SARC_15832 [Sphaeroforma arctica JP610]KNC71630.1 hypothetical protein SARC_15832 [Sphaeroforma arctica JP610]|eukprot:XP_014145532.1 hypothetical protein SARC_15832 [Sphaeroforma arctica JP610]